MKSLDEVLAGLGSNPKTLPCKLFYDERGSALFEEICTLPEYYVTATELGIMEHHADEMAAALGPDVVVVELGSGSATKTRLLLDQLERPRAYVPVDLALAELERSASELRERYPDLAVVPRAADFSAPFALPANLPEGRRAAYFPGSTIGNFEAEEARALLARIASFAEDLLLGFDLKKDPALLHAAYNDARGVTAAFNLNLLARLNREFSADFDLGAFDHYAPYNPTAGRIEMYLIARRALEVHLAGRSFVFEAGEAILTEHSHKYTVAGMKTLAAAGGWQIERAWTDPEALFAVALLRRGRS